MANYLLVGAKELGCDIFEVKDGKMTLNFDKDVIRKLWDNYYVPYVKGYFAASGRFRSDDVKTGNVIGYGGTSGRIFINGIAGERFAIRNSGVTMVAEGIGDHGCEYMTGGRVVVLGTVGMNFAAGMTGGLAYVYDEKGHFDLRCNLDGVDLESIEPGSEAENELKTLIEEHLHETGSPRAAQMLAQWEQYRPRFVRVFPVEYRAALARQAAAGQQEA